MNKPIEGDIVYRFFDISEGQDIPGVEHETLWRVDCYEHSLDDAMHGEHFIVLWTNEEVLARIAEKEKTEKGEVFRICKEEMDL